MNFIIFASCLALVSGEWYEDYLIGQNITLTNNTQAAALLANFSSAVDFEANSSNTTTYNALLECCTDFYTAVSTTSSTGSVSTASLSPPCVDPKICADKTPDALFTITNERAASPNDGTSVTFTCSELRTKPLGSTLADKVDNPYDATKSPAELDLCGFAQTSDKESSGFDLCCECGTGSKGGTCVDPPVVPADDGGLGTATIIGIVIAVIVVGYFAWMFYKRRSGGSVKGEFATGVQLSSN